MPEPILQISYSLAGIENDVHQFWQSAHRYKVFAFSGELGAGKTTFIHAVCDYLGVKDTVSSPTFSIINEYHFQQDGKDTIIFHMDWYRLRDPEEAIRAGVEDALSQPGAYSFIEWPERAPALLPLPYLWIEMEVTGELERRINVMLVG